MKIYSYIRMDIDGNILEEISHEYKGEIAECKGGNISVPPPSEEEKAIQKEILDQLQTSRELQAQFLPYLLETSGYRQDEEGNLVKIPYEEYLQSLDPIMRQQYENLALIQEQAGKALRGELEVSPALEQQIEKQRQTMGEGLSRRLGTNWAQTSAGIVAQQEFDKSAEALREQARYGALQTYGGLGAQSSQMLSATPGAQIGTGLGLGSSPASLVGLYQGALAPYERQRQLQLQASMQNAQSGGSGLGGVLGTLGGAALGYFTAGAGNALGAAALGGGLGGTAGGYLGTIV